VGASGIGKHHAKWWHIEGADVCGFVGTSPESVARTHEAIKAMFPFSGRGYVSLDRLIEAERPDVVDVCSPPSTHVALCRMALAAGCHVLCEKPLAFDPGQSTDTLLAEARNLVAFAEEQERLFGVCTQYSVGADGFVKIWRERRGAEPIERYHGHLEAPAKGRAADPFRIWVDLSPHLLSVLLRVAPNGRADWSTLEVRFDGYEARASFDVIAAAGTRIACDLITRNTTQPPAHVRHFKLNGYAFVVEGETNPEGVYGARIETPDGDYHEADAMRLLIRGMAAGQPPAGGREALVNLEWMLRIRDAAAGT